MEDNIEYEHRLTALESQSKRFISDVESEKDTRKRANAEISHNFEKINRRLTAVERTVWAAFGALLSVELILRLFKIL